MSRRKPLSCQSKKVCIVIRKNKTIPIEKLKDYCFSYFDKFAFIEHSKDIDSVTGEVIPVHYHIVGDFKTSKIPFSTRLNEICTFFHFDNSNGIEIDQYNSLESSIQYLTHKNQCEKTPHKKEEIIHNFDSGDFEILYNATCSEVLTLDLVLVACLESNNIIEVMRKLGFENFSRKRNSILDVWYCCNNDPRYIKQ